MKNKFRVHEKNYYLNLNLVQQDLKQLSCKTNSQLAPFTCSEFIEIEYQKILDTKGRRLLYFYLLYLYLPCIFFMTFINFLKYSDHKIKVVSNRYKFYFKNYYKHLYIKFQL